MSARQPSSSRRTRDERGRRGVRRAGRRHATAPPVLGARWSCCSTAGARTSARSCRWRRTCPRASSTRRCGRPSPRAAATRGSPTAASAARWPTSLEATMRWFRGWLDAVAPAGRPVVLVGFSGGAAFAGGLVLTDPVAVRRCRDPLRHPALRRRRAGRPRPARAPARVRGTGRGGPGDPARAARPHLGLPPQPTPARPPSAAATRVGTASPPPPCAGCPSGSPTGSGTSARTARPRSACRSTSRGRRCRMPCCRTARDRHRRCRGRSRSSSSRRTPRPRCRRRCSTGSARMPGVRGARTRSSRCPGARAFTLPERQRAGRGLPRAAGPRVRAPPPAPTTARCTWPCPRRRRPTSSPTAGASPTRGPARGSRPGSSCSSVRARPQELETVAGVVAASHAAATAPST